MTLLEIDDLCVAARGAPILAGVSLEVNEAEIVGVVGESGSGKSTLARTIARLLPPDFAITGGRARLRDLDLLRGRPATLHRLRPGGVSMVFQSSVTALNPVVPVGEQVAEALRPSVGRRRATDRSVELLERMGLRGASGRLGHYPHQFSGGQRQRIVIAIALATEPALLLADEPTSAVDVTTQAAILELFSEVVREQGTAMVLISHNYAVVSQMCATTLVLYAGRALERGSTAALLRDPRHPYTRGLIASLPSVDRRVERLEVIPGAPPVPGTVSGGCPFAPRCRHAEDACAEASMALRTVAVGHDTACVRVADIDWRSGHGQVARSAR
jgi:oligopeptide/dipeptide ABC transporter ATP-binding protein